MGVVHEPGSDRYAPTELARALAIPKYRDGIPFWFVYPVDPHLVLKRAITNESLNQFRLCWTSIRENAGVSGQNGLQKP